MRSTEPMWNEIPGGFNPESAADYLPPPQLHDLQLQRLRSSVQQAYDHVQLFHQRMEERKLKPNDIQQITDIALLPFTMKNDLRDTYPFGLFASSMNDVVRLHASSGTTGKPIVVAYTQQDVDVWASVMVRSFAACGLHRGDIIQNAYGYGLFTGGLGAHYGAEALGATVIPISGGNTDRQIMVMHDFRRDRHLLHAELFHAPDGALAEEMKLRPPRLARASSALNPGRMPCAAASRPTSGIKAYDIYGLSEIIGPGVGIECCCQDGLHIFEDHFYPEIIDPVTCQVLPDGAEGELVLTTLSKQAMPMIRYRTRDMTRLLTAACPCGRTIRRIGRITRRSDDMFIIRGVNVFPSQVEAALLAVEGTLPHYQIVLTREKGLDHMTIRIEVTPEVFSDKIRALENLQKKLDHSVDHILGIRAVIQLVEPRSIQRSEGKAKRVIDQRNI